MSRIIGALQHGRVLFVGMVFVFFAGTLSILAGTALGLANFQDVGFPDSAILLRIADFVRSGHIYPAFDRPPYMVTVYGPLTYVLLGLPYGLAQLVGVSPQVSVRLVVLSALCLDVFLVFLISRRLDGSRRMAWLCALCAVSALPVALWTTQIRGDFPALLFSLLSVYLFLRAQGRPLATGAAAVCAGVAPLVKQTFIAAPVAVFGWLIYKRRFKDAALWATGCAVTAAGGYAIAWWREPLMLDHFAALRHPIFEYRGAVDITWLALSQPAVPFAAIGAVLALRGGNPEKVLFVIYWVTAWLVALFTIPQVGGNINYFWESFMTSAVLAGPGLYELQRKASRTPLVVAAIVVVLLARAFLPVVRENMSYLSRCYKDVRAYHVRKAEWDSLVSFIAPRRLLSTVPSLTFRSRTQEIPEPYLNAMLERRGHWDSRPVAAQIDAAVYDVIVIGKRQADNSSFHRGVSLWSDAMWSAMKRTYTLACTYERLEVWLPMHGSGDSLRQLSAIGCAPVDKAAGSRF